MIILDFETNSSNPKDVLEVAALKVKITDNGFEIIDTFHRYYYTKYEINLMAFEVHKLSLEKIETLRNGNKYAEFFEDDYDFIEFCNDTSILVAHNVSFELRYLDNMVTFQYHICTMNSNRQIVKALSKINRIKNPKLIETCKFYNIEFDIEKYHSAIYDVSKTLDIINSMEFNTISDIYEENIRQRNKYSLESGEKKRKRAEDSAKRKALKTLKAEEKKAALLKRKLERKKFLLSIQCPLCQSYNIQKSGKRVGKTFIAQRYQCMNCNRRFSEKIEETSNK